MINHPYTREKHERLREAVKKFQEVSRPWNRPLASGLNYLGTIPPAVISVFFFGKLLKRANLISGFFFGLISVALFNFISTVLIYSVIFIPRLRGRKYFRSFTILSLLRDFIFFDDSYQLIGNNMLLRRKHTGKQ